MKKVLISLAMIAFLASCGAKPAENTPTNTTETKTETTTTTTSNNVCEKYTAYMECTLKKSGLADADINTTMEQYKSAFATLPADQQAPVCQQAIDVIKSNSAMMVPGCDL